MAIDSTVAKYLDDDGDRGDLSDDERAELDGIRALLGDPGLWAEPSASLEDSIIAAITVATGAPTGFVPSLIAGDHVSSGVPSAIAPVAAPSAVAMAPANVAAGSPNVVSIRASRSFRRDTRPPSRLGNFVAGLAVAAVIVGGVLIVRHFPTSDDGRTTTLAGAGALPGATGTITWFTTNSGVRIELDATGLPRLDDDNFYEAWLKSADGSELVPVGTFHTGTKVTLWAGVSTTDYPTFTVTREHAAGPDSIEQGSSGDVVLKGTISG